MLHFAETSASMSKANELVEALRKQGAPNGIESVRDFWIRQRTIWLEDLTNLQTSIRRWLAPVVEAKLASIVDHDFSTDEPDVGHYMAHGLSIELLIGEPKSLFVRPRGMRVVGLIEDGGRRITGANGRVDIEYHAKREILLRFGSGDNAKWFSFAGGEKRELDEDLFVELLARIAEVEL